LCLSEKTECFKDEKNGPHEGFQDGEYHSPESACLRNKPDGRTNYTKSIKRIATVCSVYFFAVLHIGIVLVSGIKIGKNAFYREILRQGARPGKTLQSDPDRVNEAGIAKDSVFIQGKNVPGI